MKKKLSALMLTTVVLGSAVIGGTSAWLVDQSDEVVNTFTYGNIDIDLSESVTDFKMIPGQTITKDPKITVDANSEASWLFVEVKKSSNYGTFLAQPDVETGWIALEGTPNIYYREVESKDINQDFYFLKDNQVKTLDTVTKENMDALKNGTEALPTLTFKAYAIQKTGFDQPLTAWEQINK